MSVEQSPFLEAIQAVLSYKAIELPSAKMQSLIKIVSALLVTTPITKLSKDTDFVFAIV